MPDHENAIPQSTTPHQIDAELVTMLARNSSRCDALRSSHAIMSERQGQSQNRLSKNIFKNKNGGSADSPPQQDCGVPSAHELWIRSTSNSQRACSDK
jgi:hypothetical protein